MVHTGGRMKFGHRCNGWHVRLRAVTGDSVLNLEVIEALALVQSVGVASTTALGVADKT